MAAGGAVEVEIMRQLNEAACRETGLEQYAITKFAEALEVCAIGLNWPLGLQLASRNFWPFRRWLFI